MNEVAIHKLIAAATTWAVFQDGDSLEDQARDPKLKAEAIEARERLLKAIEVFE